MDLGFLAPAYAASGPVATAYLDTTSAVEGAAAKIAARWQARREELAAQGADEATLEAMGEAAGRDHGAEAGQVLVGGGARLLLDGRLPAPPRRETASWGPLPDVLPMVSVLADAVPYVLVVADRAGADITGYGDHGDAAGERHVSGGTFDIRKLKPGDWAARSTSSARRTSGRPTPGRWRSRWPDWPRRYGRGSSLPPVTCGRWHTCATRCRHPPGRSSG